MFCIGQPGSELLCTTTLNNGTVVARTIVGAASASYQAAILLLPPSITSVTPLVWNPAGYTLVTVSGARLVRIVGEGRLGRYSRTRWDHPTNGIRLLCMRPSLVAQIWCHWERDWRSARS